MLERQRDLPPRQQLAKNFPTVGETEPSKEALDLKTWTLSIGGEVENPMEFNWSAFHRLPQQIFQEDIHCVTRWSKLDTKWEGVTFRDIAELVKPTARAKFVQFIAYSENNHHTSLPLEVCMNEGVIFAHSVDGKPLEVEHGYPLRTVAPSKYFYKSLKWVKEVRFLEEDVLGTWEQGGYHNEADFHAEKRYVSGNLKKKEVMTLRANGNFAKYAGQALISIDLSGVDYSGGDLSGVQLKNCNLTGMNLAGCDLRGANFTNSDLRGSNLRGANLDGADLDGVLLMGANLSFANLSNTFLNATEFTRDGEDDAVVVGMILEGARTSALLKAQRAFLLRKGVLSE